MTFSSLDLILFAGVSQGLFLIFSLYFVTKKNREANKWLLIILCLATFIFAGKIAMYKFSNFWVWRVSIFTDTFIFLFGPLLYMYMKTLVRKDYLDNTMKLSHFTPSFLFFLFFCWTLTKSSIEYSNLAYTKPLGIFYFIVEVSGVVLLILYAIKSYKLIRFLNATEKKELSYRRNLTTYFYSMIIGILLITVFWTIGIYITYIVQVQSYLSYRLIWVCMPAFLFVIGYFSLTQPEIVRLPMHLSVKVNPSKNRLNAEEVTTLSKKLDILMQDEQLFTLSELSLKMLAKRLETTPNNLSWMLNSVYGKTFYEYINEFRVKAFLAKIAVGEHKQQTLLGIAMDVGFNSKSTFNKSFKTHMNETPSRYIAKNFSS